MRICKRTVAVLEFLFIILAIFLAPGFAQLPPEDRKNSKSFMDSIRVAVNDTTVERYIINAKRLDASERISVNGLLNESVWQEAEHATGLLEKEPFPLYDMIEPTEFAILYDDENIYIGVWCWDSEPKKIIRQINPRGSASPDNLYLFLDTYHDHRTGYKFNVSPTGVQADELRYDDFKRDFNWNGIWYSKCSIDNKGWYAEIKIPFFNLRYRDIPEHIWGFNIMRNISKNASRGQWKPHLPEWANTTRMSKIGHIVGINNIKSGRRFEFIPYSLSGLSEQAPQSATGQLNYGLDFKYSPSTNITTDLTINPDFAQVDADVLDINLTRFPTRFKELRPFFTERTNVFNTPIELFYSRRIGARGDILGGAKVTGKLAKGVEFGSLACITGSSDMFNLGGTSVNPEQADYAVVRLKKDLFKTSSIGFLGATREKSGSYNRVMGLDGSFVLRNLYLLDVQFARGQTEKFDTKNMAYYAHVTRTGDLLGLEAEYSKTEPYFEINDIGYLQKELYRGSKVLNGQLSIGPRINRHHVRRVTFNVGLERNADLFTDQYINAWLSDNENHSVSSEFGIVLANPDGKRQISGGKRTFQNWRHDESLKCEFLNETEFLVEYSGFRNTELTDIFTGDFWQATYATRTLNKGNRFAGTISINKGSFYNYNQKYYGKLQRVELTGEGRLRYNIISSLEGEYTQTKDPYDQRDGRFWRFSSRTSFMFTKDFYFRIHLQGHFGTTYYNTRLMNNNYLLSSLLSWQFQPGSFFYLAYNEGRLDQGDSLRSRYFLFNDRTLVLKLSYRFNI